MLSPGRARLSTMPSLTGSPPIAKTIGIVLGTTGLALTTEPVPPVATNTVTPCRTRSLANTGRRSICPSAKRDSMATFCPLDVALLLQPLAKCSHDAGGISRASLAEVADHRHRLLLRGGSARQRYRAAKQGNEASTVHSILIQPQPHENLAQRDTVAGRWVQHRGQNIQPPSAHAGTAGIGASRPLRRTSAIVSFLNPQPALSLVGGNRSSCPIPVVADTSPEVYEGGIKPLNLHRRLFTVRDPSAWPYCQVITVSGHLAC